MKKNKYRKIALYIIVAAVLIAALYFINNPITANSIVNTNTTKVYEFARSAFPEYYSLLPPKPADFDEIQIMWQRGFIRDDPDRINASYWKQPEWFPRYPDGFVKVLDDLATSNRKPIWGIGIFDAQNYRLINKDWLENPTMPTTAGHGILEIKNDSVVISHRFWIRSSVGALQIFGVGLHESYPSEATLLANAMWGIDQQKVKQDPEMVKKYISVSAVEHECGCKEFNLGTYLPQLSPDYQKQVDVTAEINKDIPKGLYVVSVEVGSPTKDYQLDQSSKYGLTYTDPNIGMFVNPVSFELFIEVI